MDTNITNFGDGGDDCGDPGGHFDDDNNQLNWKYRIAGSHKKNKFSNVNYQSNPS